jgi:hypothetical protein
MGTQGGRDLGNPQGRTSCLFGTFGTGRGGLRAPFPFSDFRAVTSFWETLKPRSAAAKRFRSCSSSKFFPVASSSFRRTRLSRTSRWAAIALVSRDTC